MLRKALPFFGILLASALAAPVAAATFNNVSGVVIEGGVKPAAGSPPPGLLIGDFNSTLGDPILNIVGSTEIYGGVAHRFPGQYTDAWTMNFGAGLYDVIFNWQKTSTNFDGQLLVNGISTLLGSAGSLSLGQLTGTVTFEVDPKFGVFAPVQRNKPTHEVATWDLQATQVAPVPLPAGMVLMLSGLGGLAFMRRRKSI